MGARDIAHELKTPIAELRNLSEVGARWPEDRASVRQFFEDTGAIAQQMKRGSSCIFWLWRAMTRATSRCGRPRFGSRRWSTPPGSPWRPRRPPEKGLTLRQEIARGLRFETHPEKLALVVSNLLSNAVAYSPPGTVVVCKSGERNGGTRIGELQQ